MIIDIIFLALLAVVVFIKLRNQLGKIDNNQGQKYNAIKEVMKEQINVKKNNNSKNESKDNVIDINSIQILNSVDRNIKEELELGLKKANISAAHFIQGANKAFQLVVESFAASDEVKLKQLLSDKIFNQFKLAIDNRAKNNLVLNTNLIAIKKSDIISVSNSDNFIHITVRFVSEQINFISDAADNIVEGDKNTTNEIKDIWEFKKDHLSSNPNWIISKTKS